MSPSAIATIETTASLTSLISYYDEKSSYIELNGANIPKHIIGAALKDKVENIDHDACEPGDEDTFFVADLGEVYRQHMRWKLNLPRVKPFYGEFFFHREVNETNDSQLSNVTLIHKSSASCQSLELVSTVPPRRKLNKSSSPTLILPASSTLNHARQTLMCDMLPAKESNR